MTSYFGNSKKKSMNAANEINWATHSTNKNQ